MRGIFGVLACGNQIKAHSYTFLNCRNIQYPLLSVQVESFLPNWRSSCTWIFLFHELGRKQIVYPSWPNWLLSVWKAHFKQKQTYIRTISRNIRNYLDFQMFNFQITKNYNIYLTFSSFYQPYTQHCTFLLLSKNVDICTPG